MAGYIGKSQGVTQVDGYNRSEADAEFVQVTGDTMTGALAVNGNLTVDTNTLFVDAANNRVGVGTAAPSDQLTVVAAAGGIGYALVGRAADGYGRLQSYDRSGTVGTGSLAFFEDGTISFNRSNTGSLVENARIDTSGNLLVGTTVQEGNGVTLYGNGVNGTYVATTSTTNYWITNLGQGAGAGTIATIYSDTALVGSISVTASSTAYNTSSDYRLKTDAQPMTGASARVQALKPVNFAWKVDGSRVDGFLAHEAQEVVPECVTGEKDQVQIVEIKDEDGNVTGTEEQPVYQGIDQSKIVPLLVAALQEAMAEIAELKADVAALKGA
jgi:hypothetical protein